MGFKKAKKTFLSQAGRKGAPSALKPFAKKNTKAVIGKMAAGNGRNTKKVKNKVVRNGAPLKTGSLRGAINNYRTGAKADEFGLGKGVAARLKNYFMSKGPKLSSATNSPQSTSNTANPRS